MLPQAFVWIHLSLSALEKGIGGGLGTLVARRWWKSHMALTRGVRGESVCLNPSLLECLGKGDRWRIRYPAEEVVKEPHGIDSRIDLLGKLKWCNVMAMSWTMCLAMWGQCIAIDRYKHFARIGNGKHYNGNAWSTCMMLLVLFELVDVPNWCGTCHWMCMNYCRCLWIDLITIWNIFTIFCKNTKP